MIITNSKFAAMPSHFTHAKILLLFNDANKVMMTPQNAILEDMRL